MRAMIDASKRHSAYHHTKCFMKTNKDGCMIG